MAEMVVENKATNSKMIGSQHKLQCDPFVVKYKIGMININAHPKNSNTNWIIQIKYFLINLLRMDSPNEIKITNPTNPKANPPK